MHPDRAQQPFGFLLHTVLFLGCVGLPAFITLLVPVCTVSLEREGERVMASVRWNCFFMIPYHRRVVGEVTAVDDRVIAGEMTKDMSRGPGDTVREFSTETQGYLVIHGKAEEVKVPVSPENLRDALEKTAKFLKAKGGEPRLRFRTVANWKFGVIAGGLTTGVAAIYLWTVAAWWLRRGQSRKAEKPWRWKG
jgi:hypothetical protein